MAGPVRASRALGGQAMPAVFWAGRFHLMENRARPGMAPMDHITTARRTASRSLLRPSAIPLGPSLDSAAGSPTIRSLAFAEQGPSLGFTSIQPNRDQQAGQANGGNRGARSVGYRPGRHRRWVARAGGASRSPGCAVAGLLFGPAPATRSPPPGNLARRLKPTPRGRHAAHRKRRGLPTEAMPIAKGLFRRRLCPVVGRRLGELAVECRGIERIAAGRRRLEAAGGDRPGCGD